ncbi:MAG: RING finger protein [Chloroflexota bacterium]
MIRAHSISEESTFLGQTCALCKQEFEVGDRIVICPKDGSRHHAHCWQANGNRCTAYGCTGQGEIGVTIRPRRRQPAAESSQTVIIPNPAAHDSAHNPPSGSKVRVMPARNFGCARSCLFLTILFTLILLGAACFGLWTLADTIINKVPQWHFGAALIGPAIFTMIRTMFPV